MEENTTVLIKALEKNEVLKALRLLEVDPSLVLEEGENDITPLMVASAKGFVPIVTKIVEKGANVHAANVDENTALHMAARRGHLKVVDILLDSGANPMSRNVWGETPLIYAAEEGGLTTVKRLISRPDVEVDAEDVEGQTPLVSACLTGQREVVRTLLKAGANCEHLDKVDLTLVPQPPVPDRNECIRIIKGWRDELERAYFTARLQCLGQCSTPQPDIPVSDAHIPHFFRPRLVSGAPLPRVEVVGMSGQQQEKAPKRRVQEIDGGVIDMPRTVAHFIMSELSQDLFKELVGFMPPN